MNLKLVTCFVLFSVFQFTAQEKAKDLTSQLISKGTFFVGASADFAFGYAPSEGRFIVPAKFIPKMGYFIFDRLSLGLSYQGAALITSVAPRFLMYHKGELELNHYFYARKHLLLYTQTGISFEQYSLPGYYQKKTTAISLKLGAGISWRLKKVPAIGMNVEAAYYIGSGTQSRLMKFPNITFGISYFFQRKKRGNKKTIPF